MMAYNEIRNATLDQLTDELAAAGWDSTQTELYEARDAVARLICETQELDLHDYRTGDSIRKATADEAGESINAGDEGVITVDCQRCYVA